MQQGQDPRATVIKNNIQQQYLLQQVLKQIPPLQEITFDQVIDLFEKCYDIRQEPQFIHSIFDKNAIYQEFVMWLFQPIKMTQIRLRKSNKLPKGQWKNKYPFVCMQIAKQNNSFYEQLYLKAYFQEGSFLLWFNFLKQPNSETLPTSLGYLTEILLPFLKYQFSDSTQICQKIANSCDEDILVSSYKLSREETPLSQQRKQLEFSRKRTYLQQQISILKIFSDQFFNFVFNFITHEAIFKFVHNLILVSLEESDLKRSKKICQAFLRKSLDYSVASLQDGSLDQKLIQDGPVMDACNEYVLQVLKQIQENANTQKNYRVIFFVDSMIRVNVISLFIERIENSFLMAKQNGEEKMTTSMDFTAITAEEEIIEYYLKSLSIFIKIYSKMIKTNKTSQEIERESKFYGDQQHEQEQVTGQEKVMREFSLQVQQIFKKLPSLSTLVKKTQVRSLSFSSGQNIKPVTFCRFQFFQLIYNCLLLSSEHPQDFIINTENLNLFSIIQRYLQQNRWNNLTHQILQKITCLLIKSNKKFFRTAQMSKNNMADQFLNSIIEAFTNKKYIFLNSLRFTTQGNLHVLYNIAKGIISELKESHKLANLIHQFEYYKNFTDDLRIYQVKILQVQVINEMICQYPAEQEDLRNSENRLEDNQIKLWVDELYVGQMIKKVQTSSKWPVKQSRRKHGSFIQRSLSSMSNQHLGSSAINPKSRIKDEHQPSQQQLLLSTEDEIDAAEQKQFPNVSKIKLFSAMQSSRQYTKSGVDNGSKKSNFMESSFIKNHVKKIQSQQLTPQPTRQERQGSGLFTYSINQNNQNMSTNSIHEGQDRPEAKQAKQAKQQNLVINVFCEQQSILKKSTSLEIKFSQSDEKSPFNQHEVKSAGNE